MRWLKNDAPRELAEAVRQLEERADACFRMLLLLKLPWNIAVWSLLVGGIRLVEQEIAARGDNTPHLDAALLNVSRYIPIAVRWSTKHGRPVSKLANSRWTPALSATVDEALAAAHNYSAFLTCLPMWHKNRYLAEPISPNLVRFTAPGSGRHRQVSAHQKGFRPKEGDYKGERAAKPEQSALMQKLFSEVFQVCRKTGMLRFEYNDPWGLWSALVPEYQSRVTAIVRRADFLSLGDYTLSDFKQFYAALLAVCAAHEFLCFTWEKNYGRYPLDSSVMIRSRTSWIAILSKLSSIPADKCRAIFSDLTFDFSHSLDLHVHPFVPLDSWTTRLAIAPQFPLHSRPDENILRVCSMLRPTVFSTTSLEKEPEILASLRKAFSHYAVEGPISLPKPKPDIDFLVRDDSSSTLVIAELKWVRKTGRPVEFTDRDGDVLKGVGQLEQIKRFLIDNPHHLSSLGKLPRSLTEYRNVYYLLVARDHWLWMEPNDDVAIVEFDALLAAVGRSRDLNCAIADLLKYEWLPAEGRDFTVQYDVSTANGASLESEVFYPA